eukprot:TRINITY_DN3890_c0_g1_i5.p1 TRINITY_DN3890_c0_g1~~TRINITY_DN3890_c0_g1_i5.p1  ORF type:complete len:718 (-),score=100.40 TRINITY_DN3890_c0_g1_i5:123-2219(-)
MAASSSNADDLLKSAASDSDVEVGQADEVRPVAERGRGRLLAVGCAALAGAALIAAGASHQARLAEAPTSVGFHNIEEKVEVTGTGLATTASPLFATTLAPAPVVTAAPINPIPAATLAPAPLVTAAPVPVTTVGPNGFGSAQKVWNQRRKPSLKPDEGRHDGNVCDDNEELLEGLCYTKCDILTNGAHPFRKSAFSCCKTSRCVDTTHLDISSMLPCEGYDVSTEDGGTACPHSPGICLEDEDQFLNQCYEKCSILTKGKYPNRVAAATCCNTEGIACMNPFNDKTSPKFDVGGGKGDGDTSTPTKPHPPLKSLTESAHSSGVLVSTPGPKVANTRKLPKHIIPKEGRHDGNPCEDTEEMNGGLCYRKCDILTGGKYPFRKSAFACCKTAECHDITKMDVAGILPCSGYDVSSEENHTGCPHGAGACLSDEDEFLDECYEKCSILTDGRYPNRVAAATCCNTEGVSCTNPFNDLTSAKFDVGGGKGDGRDSTPSKVHPPLKSLTESAHSNGVLVTTPGPDLANVRRRPVNITPSENMHDGNPCDDTEEYFGGLCYRKCSILTNGEAPFRTSAFACCKVKSCTLALTKMKVASVLPCAGYDVSSEDGATACPHGSGICLQDEDQYLDECYEKCSILTNGKYSNRVAPATCCDGTGISCMNPFNLETDAKFDVGGGKGDGKKSTPSAPHLPDDSLTEAR